MKQNCRCFSNHIENPKAFINTLESPALLMQGEPRQVVTANQKARKIFGKNLLQIEGHRGGQVFDCIHSFTEAGCGVDINCEECKIKDAIVDTFLTDSPHNNVSTVLEIKKQNEIEPYEVTVSTEKLGDFALVTIEKYTAEKA